MHEDDDEDDEDGDDDEDNNEDGDDEDDEESTVYTLDLETMELGTVGGDVKYQRYYHSNTNINNDVYLFGGFLDRQWNNDL